MEVTEHDGWFLMQADKDGMDAGRYAQFQTLGSFIVINTGHERTPGTAVWMEPDEAIMFGEKLIAAAKAVKEA